MGFHDLFTKLGEMWDPRWTVILVIAGILTGLILFAQFLNYQIRHKSQWHNKEFGSARLISGRTITRKYGDEDASHEVEVYGQDGRKIRDRKGNPVKINNYNRQISENIFVSLDKNRFPLNLNLMCVAMSGAGKTFRVVKPILASGVGSTHFVCADPKGELVSNTQGFFRANDYNVLILDVQDEESMTRHSHHFNFFPYATEEKDILEYVELFLKATNLNPDSKPTQDFWETSKKLLLQGLFLFVYYEYPADRQNLRSVIDLLNWCEFIRDPETGVRIETTLDKKMEAVNLRWKKAHDGQEHPAYTRYHKCMSGAEDTVKSILQNVYAACGPLMNEAVLSLFDNDEMDIVHNFGLSRKPTILYLVSKEGDTSSSFIISMLYLVMLRTLYTISDKKLNNEPLPMPVSFIIDEMNNVVLPDNIIDIESTCRSRGISLTMIWQDLTQCKNRYERIWGSMIANASIVMCLGSQNKDTLEYFSQMVGKTTIRKSSRGVSRGKTGSTSENEDLIGRDLMMIDEIRKMENEKCIVILSGEEAVLDDKVKFEQHPLYEALCTATPRQEIIHERGIRMISEEEAEYLISVSQVMNGNDGCLTVTLADLLSLPVEIMEETEAEESETDHLMAS